MKDLNIKTSERLFAQARRHLVGGVNSPVRSFRAVGGTPLFIDRAKGPCMIDVDGNSYVDFVCSWGPLILGHAHETVLWELKKCIEKGTSFGAPTEVEIQLAEVVTKAMPSIEQVRFTNSGTEATMSALRLARAVTKRERILKFEGGYHGHSDGLLVDAGSGATTFGVPSSAGVPESWARTTWVLPYNNSEIMEETFRRQGPNIAAVIVEPVCGNMGVVLPKKDFLENLRRLTKKYGILLIFDEVMTGFRLAWGGAQERFSISPDITCLGKIIGGGFPVGAFGGSHEVMEKLAPLGPVYQAGTLSGNPMAMTAGLATLNHLKKLDPYNELESQTKDLCKFIKKEAQRRKIHVQINHVASMFTVFFALDQVEDYGTAMLANTKQYAAFFHALLKRGVYMPPSQFEAAFLSCAHDTQAITKAKSAFAGAFEEMASAL